MGTTISKSFTATGSGTALSVKHGDSFDYSVSGTFSATVVLQESTDGGVSWSPLVTATAATSGNHVANIKGGGSAQYRFTCSAFTSGTVVTSIADVDKLLEQVQNSDGTVLHKLTEGGYETLRRPAQVHLYNAAGLAKAGATAGFVVGASDDVALVTCPASQTAATVVVPIPHLKVGSIIESFYLVGQIESAGGTVTVDADLRVQTAVAADVSDASVGAITQLSVTADAAMSSSNTEKSGLSQTVAEDESYYVLITATTGASTDIALMGVAVSVIEV